MDDSSQMQNHDTPKVVDRNLTEDAAKATEAEHNLGVIASLKLYPQAVAWSLLLSTAVIMEGFDLVLMASLFAFPAFEKKFGVQQPNGSYHLTASWQTGLKNGAVVGEIIGLLLNGIIAEKIGYRKTMIGALILLSACVFFHFFAPNIVVLLVGQILIGIPWGVFQTLPAVYAAEVCPTHLRAYLTTYVNLCWLIGQFIASGVLRAMLSRTDEWAYRIPFALQWMWPVPLIVGLIFAPESPWQHIRKGRVDNARKSLARLTSSKANPDFDIDQAISMMVHTNKIEEETSRGSGYIDCFRATDLRRTHITCGAWVVTMICGTSLSSYSTYFFEQAGLSVTHAFSLSLGLYAIGAVGTILSWILVMLFGRRILYLTGLSMILTVLLVIGFASLAKGDNSAAQWAIGSMLLIMTFVYNSAVGPVCYTLVTEIPSTRLKTKTVVLARSFYIVFAIVTNTITPLMLNPTAWNWGAKSGFFWAGSCALCLVWTFFVVPEPKGRTYGELDIFFKEKVPTRKFKTTSVGSLSPMDLGLVNEDDVKSPVVVKEHIETVRSSS